MKKKFMTLLAGMALSSPLAMGKVYTGTVIGSEDDEPLIGASVVVKNDNKAGVITDIDGNFSIDVDDPNKLIVISYLGYEPLEIASRLLKDDKNIFRLKPTANSLEEVVVTGMGARKKITMTGAVTNVNMDDVKHFSTSNISNALAGNVPGILAMQTSGQPGKNKSEFWIRGISTFGAAKSAYILVDGFERESIDDLNIEDIETFTVLKDASATAIYGSKGANGVVLITTKRGKDGKLNVNVKLESSYNTRTKTPKFVDGLTYAGLLNEAYVTRSKGVYFTPTELELFRNGLDPDLYPNVDWKDLVLKDGAMSYRVNTNISGGGPRARYYASISYVTDEGMYKTDKTLRDKYDTNANYNRWNYRLNLDINLSSSTILRLGTAGDLSMRNSPGMGDNDTWLSLFGYNAILTPIMYSNGYVPMINLGGGDNVRTNPWVMTTQTGYRQEWNNNLQNNVSLEQDLDFVTRGLKFTGRFGYDTYNWNCINHLQEPERWYATGRKKDTGEIEFQHMANQKPMEQSSDNNGSRRIFLDLLMSYNRDFGSHNIGANLKYTYDNDIRTQNIGTDIKNSVSRKNMALAGQVSYRYQSRYFADVNFGYNGSENFADGHRFGFFPAASAGWNLAAEPFMEWAGTWLDVFKFRYSYGKVGNDRLGDNRFPYLYTIGETGDRVYNFGTFATPTRGEWMHGLHYESLASRNVTWEVATKQDAGLDVTLFNNRFSITVDYFHEKRTGIYMERKFLPGSLGLESSPSANVGAVKSEGVDGFFRYEDRFGDVTLTLRGNLTYSHNTILNYDVENNVYPYQYQTGHRVDQLRGLVACGLFKDYDDIRNSPKQMFGDVQPGDIKYKDVNGDGIVDNGDQVAIGATTRPNLIYGFGFSVQWKGFDFNAHFQGSGKSSMIIQGKSVWAFSMNRYGQILSDLVDNRYIDRETAEALGIQPNENPNAPYPRLQFCNDKSVVTNNYQPSSYWMRDISYLRLKNLEVGYSLPKEFLSRIHLNEARIYLQGTNLLTFSNFKLWDPEMGSTNGESYPLTKAITLGLQINL